MAGRILCLSNSDPNLRLVLLLLKDEGYEIILADSKEKCLNILAENDIDMIIVDFNISESAAYWTLEKIRANEKTRTLPVILVTQLEDRRQKIKGIKLGADDFITKPFDKIELLVRVKTQMKLNFLRNQLTEKQKLIKIIEQMNEGVIITNSKNKPIIINETAKALLGIRQYPENALAYINENFATEIECGSNFIVRREESVLFNPLYLKITVQPINDPLNKLESKIIFVNDVTNEFLKNRLQYDFYALISHKLNTPLTSIMLSMQFLRGLINDSMGKKILEKGLSQIERMGDLIGRLLYFVRMEDENLKDSICVSAINKMIEDIKFRYPDKQLRLEKRIEIESIYEFQKIILQELLDNSFKYNDKSELILKVDITPGCMAVSDNGPGIPPEERNKIYEPFYQIEKHLTGNMQGAGLGLTLVKKISELYGVKLTLESNLGSGSTFKILREK